MDRDIYEILNEVKSEEYEVLQISEKEKAEMKRNFNKSFKKGHKKYYAIAACVAAVAVISQTAFAQSLVENIIKSVTTGHNRFVQTEQMPERAEIPDEYKGIYYDKDGNQLDELVKGQAVYNKNGEMIINENGEVIAEYELVNEDGTQIKVASGRKDDIIAQGSNDTYFVVTDKSKVAEKLNFAPAMPEYLPSGYEFYGATLYKDEKGEVSGDYLAMYYKNASMGKEFSIHERIINDETAFETGTSGEIRETTVKGNKAVIMDNMSVDWEEGGISVSVLAGKSGISIDELMKISESTVR